MDVATGLAEPGVNVLPETFNPHKGIPYKVFLGTFAKFWHPDSYFEIGTSTGSSLEQIHCASVAVDPAFRLIKEVMGRKPFLHMFQMTSDDFFAQYDMSQMFPGKHTIDMAFLDGMHHFEFLLRDFMNAEKYCTEKSAVFLHDCFPYRPICGRRSRESRPFVYDTTLNVATEKGGWSGDVWKILKVFEKYRPELKVTYLDCPPAGLTLVRGLNPKNTVIQDNYDTILAEFMDLDLRPGWFEGLYERFPLYATKPLAERAEFKKFVASVR